MSRLLIIGAGGHGAVAAEAAIETGLWQTIEFLDDDPSAPDVLGFPVVGATGELADHLGQATDVLIALGNNAHRLELLRKAENDGASLATVVHPGAHVSRSAVLGPGCAVFAGVVVNARAEIGLGAILNSGATIDHDCVIGDAAHVSPGANLAGGVKVGERSWIGIGAVVREGIAVGSDAVVAAGAAVVTDVPDGMTVGGVPARALRDADSA